MPTWVDKISLPDKVYIILMMLAIFSLSIHFTKNKRSMKLLLLFVCVHFLMELTSDYINYGLKQNNLLLYHVFAPVGYTVLALFFHNLYNNFKLKWAVIFSVPVYFFVSLLLTLYVEELDQLNSIAYMVESLLIIYWCFSFFRELLTKKEFYRPERDRDFWIVVGILIYFIGNFFTTGTLNYFIIKRNYALVTDVYYAGYAFNYLFYGTVFFINILPFPEQR